MPAKARQRRFIGFTYKSDVGTDFQGYGPPDLDDFTPEKAAESQRWLAWPDKTSRDELNPMISAANRNWGMGSHEGSVIWDTETNTIAHKEKLQ